MSQNCLMNPKFTPSGPGLLKLSQSQTAYFTSSIEKGLVRCPALAKDNFRKGSSATPGRTTL